MTQAERDAALRRRYHDTPHTDHGDWCRPCPRGADRPPEPPSQPLTDAQVETIYAAYETVMGTEARTIEGRRGIVEPLYRGVRQADGEAYVRGHWDGLNCEANGFGGRLDECEHVGRIHPARADRPPEPPTLDVERLARAIDAAPFSPKAMPGLDMARLIAREYGGSPPPPDLSELREALEHIVDTFNRDNIRPGQAAFLMFEIAQRALEGRAK